MGRGSNTETGDMPQTRGEAHGDEGVWITTSWGAEYKIDLDLEPDEYSDYALKPIRKHRKGKITREELHRAIADVVSQGGSTDWPVVDPSVKERRISRDAVAGYSIR
jgi:hypothetical protein